MPQHPLLEWNVHTALPATTLVLLGANHKPGAMKMSHVCMGQGEEMFITCSHWCHDHDCMH